MAAFCVYQPPEGRPGPPVFVRDAFNVFATALPPIWLIWRRAWLALALWLAAAAALTIAGAWVGVSGPSIAMAFLALCVLTGLEAPTIRAYGLRRRGFKLVAVIERSAALDAETAYFCQTLVGPREVRAAARAPTSGQAESVGLFIEGSK